MVLYSILLITYDRYGILDELLTNFLDVLLIFFKLSVEIKLLTHNIDRKVLLEIKYLFYDE